MMQQQALDVLGLEDVPPSGLNSHIYTMRLASTEYLDYEVVLALLLDPKGMLTSAITDEVMGGSPDGGKTVAGRLRALEQRGLVCKLRGKHLAEVRQETVEWGERDYGGRHSTTGWRLSAKALRRAGLDRLVAA